MSDGQRLIAIDGDFYLSGRRLVLMDELEVKIPLVGWRYGRFSRGGLGGTVPMALFPNGHVVQLDLDLIDEVRWPEKVPSFTCPECKRTSHNFNDVRNHYCGACHRFYA